MRGLRSLTPDSTARAIVMGALVLGALAIGPHLRNGFVWDDHGFLAENPAVNGSGPLRDALTRDAWYAHAETHAIRLLYYRPLLVVLARGLWSVGEGAPWPFHAAALTLHLAAVVLLFAAARRLGSTDVQAALAAAMFAVHPLVGEVVYWAAALGEGVLLVSLLAAQLAVWRAREGAGAARAAWLALAMIASAAAVSVKETGIVVPALVTVEALLASRDDLGARLRPLWVVWVPGAAYAVARAAFVGGTGATLDLSGFEAKARMMAAVLGWSLRRLVWPFPLSPLHLAPPIDAVTVVTAIVTTSAAAGLLVCAARRDRGGSLLAVWTVAPLLPYVAQLTLSRGTGMPVSERYLYVSLAPALVLLVRGVAALGAAARVPRPGLAGVAGAAILASALVTARYGRAFDGDDAHSNRILEVHPDHPIALVAKANQLARAGRSADAVPLLERAVRAEPRFTASRLNLGLALRDVGRRDEAMEQLTAVVRLDDANVPARIAIGDLLRDAGDLEGAGAHYALAVAAAPANADARLAFGTYQFAKGNASEALAQWEAGLLARPHSCELLFNVGLGRSAMGRRAAAEPLRRFLAACRDGFDGQRAQAERWLAQGPP